LTPPAPPCKSAKPALARWRKSFYVKIQSDDPKIGAFLTLCKDRAIAKALEMDALAAKGEKLPPLGGVPVAIKDVMVTKGVRTTAGSKILDNYVSAVRLHRSGPARFRRRCRAGQAELRRVCDGIVQRELGLEAGAQSPRSYPRSGGSSWRVSGSGGRRHGGGGAGLGHGRLDSAACLVLRCGWTGANLRTSFSLRLDRVCVFARPYWATHENGEGRRYCATDDCRP